MNARMAKATLRRDDAGFGVLMAMLRDRAEFYRAHGHDLIAAEFDHEAAILDALLRPSLAPPPGPCAS